MTVPANLRKLQRKLASPDVDHVVADRPARGVRKAAVLALISDEADPHMLFIEKSAALRHHAGQMAFPGGRAEPGDDGPVDTAIREAWEETAVAPGSVDVLGILPAAHVSASMFDVTTVVGWWHTPDEVYPADVGEVAAVHNLAVADLVRPETRASVQYGKGMRGPAFNIGELFIWGLTAHLLDALLDLAGWAQPWNSNALVDVPARFGKGLRPDSADADQH